MENPEALTTDLIIQYSIVGLILLAACVWIILKIKKRKKNDSDACCGCTIADSCKKKILKNSNTADKSQCKS